MTIDYADPTEEMVYVPPFFASLVLGADAFNVGDALNITALAILLAGVFAVARYKAALSAADATAAAWEKERDAALARAARVTEELVRTTAENSALKARPDLVELTGLVREHGDKIDTMANRIVEAIQISGNGAGAKGGSA